MRVHRVETESFRLDGYYNKVADIKSSTKVARSNAVTILAPFDALSKPLRWRASANAPRCLRRCQIDRPMGPSTLPTCMPMRKLTRRSADELALASALAALRPRTKLRQPRLQIPPVRCRQPYGDSAHDRILLARPGLFAPGLAQGPRLKAMSGLGQKRRF
jgi:hypothetical protein